MAKKPVAWMKIYTPSGDYVASCNDYAAAAVLVAFYGDGAEIRNGHAKKNAIWREGCEEQPAGESYDYVASILQQRTTESDTGLTENQQKQEEHAQAGLEQARNYARSVLAR